MAVKETGCEDGWEIELAKGTYRVERRAELRNLSKERAKSTRKEQGFILARVRSKATSKSSVLSCP